MNRVLAWFSCGAASAYSAKLAIDKYGDKCEVVYCDTLKYEHPDNKRFMKDCEKWFGKEIKLLKSEKYKDIYDVFDKTGWLVGPAGARCTTELKKLVRRKYQEDDDIHVFGYTIEEKHRKKQLMIGEPELKCYFPLIECEISKRGCLEALHKAGIEIPMMYRMGYANNNCIPCVKGGAGYFNRIKRDFPDSFYKMAIQERKMGIAILKKYVNGERVPLFLDELPPDMGRMDAEPNIECGVLCLS
jgi:3'-phosphoadenosine 5'-phosphosulfate sulfotransferase (PAPS reductase)/FAD synthetase